MQDQYVLDQWEGRLCVRADIVMSNEPTVTSLFWPIGNQCAADWQEYIGHQMDGHDGNYWLSLDDVVRPFSRQRQAVFRLENGPQTKAIHVESRPVPRPKVRRGTEIRWRYGKWEKCLRNGWVSA